ncbi:MAG: FtsW/RodA/SpoVE family cell cycle protein [Ruminococcus sp.]|nr:FtsW/RodA/SpoVE family cell cycle protein [Ruminococcus sp.]
MGKIAEEIKSYLKKTDTVLWIFTAIAIIYSLLLISDMQRAGNYNYLFTQSLAIIVGFIAAWLVSIINYKFMVKHWLVFALIAVGLAGMVFVFGVRVSGTDDTAWIRLPGGITFQPSEFMKLCFIITFTRHLAFLKENEKIGSVLGVLSLLVHVGIPIVLIHIQGDDGAVLIFLFIAIVMTFLAGVPARYYAILGGMIAVGLPVLWNIFLNNEHRNRILALFDLDGNAMTNYGWQQYQGKMSIASGQLYGAGLYNGRRVEYGIVPEQENDFIFTVAGEEFGFIGCIILLTILAVIIIRVLINAKNAYDSYGRFICCGVFAMIASQTIINIGMVLGVIPVIGITLPFFSSGGTSVLSMMISIGLVQSVMYNQEKDMDRAKIRLGSQSRAKI